VRVSERACGCCSRLGKPNTSAGVCAAEMENSGLRLDVTKQLEVKEDCVVSIRTFPHAPQPRPQHAARWRIPVTTSPDKEAQHPGQEAQQPNTETRRAEWS
jgi:hypothetical protein